VRSWPNGTVHGCPFIHAVTVHLHPASRVHAFAREQTILMLTLVTGLVAKLGIDNPQLLVVNSVENFMVATASVVPAIGAAQT
jgi:hypothetical protein